MKTLLVLSVLLNVVLVVVLNKLRKDKITSINKAKEDARKNKAFTKGLINTSIDINKELEDIKARLDSLEKKNKQLEQETTNLKDKVEALEDINAVMANNNYQLIKEGRVIKSKFLDNIFTYNFSELTRDEVYSFFGRLV